jgi:hypothetical protein
MSDDRLEQDLQLTGAEGGDVEGHKWKFKGNDEPGSDDSDKRVEGPEVEGHKFKFKGNDEPGSDDSDDEVEAHKFKFK